MVKRTQKEIEKDLKKLKEASKNATTIKDLESATGLSYAMIKTTLEKHPIIFRRIKEQLSVNKEKAESEAQKQNELSAKVKSKPKTKNETNIETLKQEQVEISKKDFNFSGFVIDASITGIENLQDIISKILLSKEKFILTSLTVKELSRLQKFKDIKGKDAAYILAMAAENPDNFESVLIDETLDTPDNCIIKYCSDNKENVILLTSDKEMPVTARGYSIKVQYFKQSKTQVNSKTAYTNNSKIRTLIPAKRVGNKLLLSNFQTNTMSICVYSDGLEYSAGIRELKVGDDVFISTKKPDYITFVHYHMISLYAENNCKLMYSKRFYDSTNIDVPTDSYMSFIKSFILNHNL